MFTQRRKDSKERLIFFAGFVATLRLCVRRSETLFWITVMGMAAIFGGAALLKKLQLTEFVIVGFMIFGAIAFLSYFGLGVWQVRRLARRGEEISAAAFEQEPSETRELNPAQPLQTSETAGVTENTTRTLEPVSRANDH